MPELKWTRRLEEAARLVAEDGRSDAEIAAEVGVSRTQLNRWKQNQEFRLRVEEHVVLWRESIRKKGLAIKERRIQSYIDDFEAIQAIRRERRDSYQTVPGGKTGYVMLEKKNVAGVAVDHATFDRALMAESREIRKQLAIELGEWSETAPGAGGGGGTQELNIMAADGNPLRALGPETLTQILQLIQRQGQTEHKNEARAALEITQNGPVIDI